VVLVPAQEIGPGTSAIVTQVEVEEVEAQEILVVGEIVERNRARGLPALVEASAQTGFGLPASKPGSFTRLVPGAKASPIPKPQLGEVGLL
jgi:hypothetical protein